MRCHGTLCHSYGGKQGNNENVALSVMWCFGIGIDLPRTPVFQEWLTLREWGVETCGSGSGKKSCRLNAHATSLA